VIVKKEPPEEEQHRNCCQAKYQLAYQGTFFLFCHSGLTNACPVAGLDNPPHKPGQVIDEGQDLQIFPAAALLCA